MTSGPDSPEVPQDPQQAAAGGDAGAAAAAPAAESVDGELREQDEAGEEASLEADLADARKAVAELTTDLQRLQAEYLNYKRRVDRDRELVRQNATYAAVTPLLEVLDTIDRAREHGELEGGFKAVADQLERVVTGLGLVRFGKPGDEFDPMLHEALSHAGTSPEVSTMTCQHVVKAGYRIGERVVRAAQVVVVDPEETTAAAAAEPDPAAEQAEQAEPAEATQPTQPTEDTDVPQE